MLKGRAARAAAAVCAAVVVVGCSADAEGAISVPTMRTALLQAADIGPTWAAPEDSPAPDPLVSLCGGDTPAPPIPGKPKIVSSPLADEGTQGAQTLSQVALVYPDDAAAAAGLAALRKVADGCPPSVSVPEKTGERQEPAFTETVTRQPLDEGGWTGVVLIRHKLYTATHPGTADTAVTVAAKRNVLLVDAYTIFKLGTDAPGADFTSDWKKLVGTVMGRVGG